jgi:hypothetical protein
VDKEILTVSYESRGVSIPCDTHIMRESKGRYSVSHSDDDRICIFLDRHTDQTVRMPVDSPGGGWTLHWSQNYHKRVPFFLNSQSRERTWEVPPVVAHEVGRRVEVEVTLVSLNRKRSDQTRQLSLLLSLFYAKHAKERISSAESMAEKYVDREHMLKDLLYGEFKENLVEVQNGEFSRNVVTVVREVVQEQERVMSATPLTLCASLSFFLFLPWSLAFCATKQYPKTSYSLTHAHRSIGYRNRNPKPLADSTQD